MRPCTLIALDTASYVTGYAVYENAVLTDSGVIDLRKDKNHWDNMAKEILLLLEKIDPDIVVVERASLIRNADTFRRLSEMIGVVMGWAIMHHADHIELVPSEWRRAVCSEGEKIPRKREECKAWSRAKVETLLHIDQGSLTDDETDAILIGAAWINIITKGDTKNERKS